MTENKSHSSETASLNGWILYDGECGFCFRWVHFWEKVVAERGFEVKDLQSAKEEGRLEIPEENLLDDIRVLRLDGEMESGVDAYLFVGRQIWWAKPIAILFGLPGFNWVLWRGYRWFNRNRYRVSRHCPLPEKRRTAGSAADRIFEFLGTKTDTYASVGQRRKSGS